MQAPEWAVQLDGRAVGITRTKALRPMAIGAGVLLAAIGIFFAIASADDEHVTAGFIVIFTGICVLLALGMFALAFLYAGKPVLRVDETGMTRLVNGYVFLPWNEVSAIVAAPNLVTEVVTPNGRTKKDGSKTRSKSFLIQGRYMHGGRYLAAYLTQCWQQAGGYRP